MQVHGESQLGVEAALTKPARDPRGRARPGVGLCRARRGDVPERFGQNKRKEKNPKAPNGAAEPPKSPYQVVQAALLVGHSPVQKLR